MSEKKEIIVFLGLKNCGKGFNSKPYINSGYKKLSFADPLREIAYDILDYTPDKKFNYDDFKMSDIVLKKGFFKKKKITTGRKILQNTGSVIKDFFGEDIWATMWYNSVLESGSNIVCDDARFTYEIEKALSLSRKGYKVKFIWCCYQGADFKEILKDSHESEALSQFIYKNQIKYGLYDACLIKHTTIKQIIKDYKALKMIK